MPVRHETFSYETIWPSVLARASNLRSPRSVELDPDYCSAIAGAYRDQKIYRPGYMAGTIPGSRKYRILPRTRTTAAITTSTTDIPVVDPSIFVPDESLFVGANTRYTVSSSTTGWVAGDTLTTTINGVAVVYTVVSGDIGGSLTATNLNIATKILAAVKADSLLAGKIDGAIVAGSSPAQVIVFWAVDGATAYTTTAAETGTNGTYVASASAMARTSLAIAFSSNADSTLTVTTAPASAWPAGISIMVPESLPIDANGKVLGMISPQQPVDLLYAPNTFHGLYTELSVYGDRLPYWDGELAGLYPAITLV